MLSEDPPEWTEKALGDSEEYLGKIAEAVSHPVETVEAMAQSAGDTNEKEGLAFMISYAVTDAAVVKAAVGKTGKAGAVRAVDKADDAAKVKKGASGGKIPKTIDGYRVIDGMVDGKIPYDDYIKIRKASVKYPESDAITLGKYNDGGRSYVKEARNNRSTHFDMSDDWEKIEKKYNHDCGYIR